MKIRITATISIDGYLAPTYEKPHRWSFSRKYALPTLRENTDVQLHKYASLLSLIIDKQNGNSLTYLVEANPETIDMINGLLLYRLADEIILYTLPKYQSDGVCFTDCISNSDWQLCKEYRFRDGTRYLLYNRIM